MYMASSPTSFWFISEKAIKLDVYNSDCVGSSHGNERHILPIRAMGHRSLVRQPQQLINDELPISLHFVRIERIAGLKVVITESDT